MIIFRSRSWSRRFFAVWITTVFILTSVCPAWAANGRENRPVPRPHPVPTPSTTPTPQPTYDLDGARRSGYHDGQADGSREGNARGPVEGDREGRERGFREGFDSCEREEQRKAYDIGYREGYVRGEYEGNATGLAQGEANGRAEGDRDGRADGLSRADRDARNEASPLGRAQGIDEANRSDATQRGNADGIASGDRDARKKAETEDYARGRKDTRDERFAEPIDSEDSFSQRGGVAGSANKKQILGLGQNTERLNTSLSYSAHPDRRFYNPRPRYSAPEERRAYEGGYNDGYNSGFQSTYRYAYDNAYDRARRLGRDDGCRSARGRNYDHDYRRGHADGHSSGYSRAYNAAYAHAHRQSYDRAFAYASENAYRDSYRGYYERHFEEARSEAYRERVGQLYQAAYNSAYRRKFDEVYPGYAAESYRRGQVDEARDFQLRPVRLLGAQATETIPNGLYEPGEALRLRIQLRNFADGAIAGKDVKIQLQALDPSSAVIGMSEAVLSRGLNAKSHTRVSELLEFRVEESAVGKATSFRVSAFFQGRNIGEQIVEIVPKFILGIGIEGVPELHEGMQGKLAVRVQNQSQVPSDAGTQISLASDASILEVLDGSVTVGILNPGESRVLEFNVIARKGGTPSVPLLVEAIGSGSRRIGLFDQTREIPVLNDYTIKLTQSLDSLRKAGIVRVEYVIRNVHSRQLLRGLQLHVRVTPKAGEPFAVLGPNPQYLSPLRNGQEASFLVPILSKAENEGAVLELEVKENGNTVVIHRSEF